MIEEKIGKLLVGILIIMFTIIASVAIYAEVDYLNRDKYCGKIVDICGERNYETRRKSKYYTHVERYVLIKFDNGQTKAVNLEPRSYYTAFIGKSVCLDLQVSLFK